MKYDLYIGRWQPFHMGHFWLINNSLQKGNAVCIAVRDVPADRDNPMPPQTVVAMLKDAFKTNKKVMVILLPDIASVNYGRGVGYGIVEHVPPKDIATISATEIRAKIKAGDETWKQKVYPDAQDFIEGFFKKGIK